MYYGGMSRISAARHAREQARHHLNEEHAGCLSVLQAARIVHVTREAIRYHMKRLDLGHQFGPGATSPYHVTGSELVLMYPELRRNATGRPRMESEALSQEEAAELLGAETIRPWTPEWDDSKTRIARRGAA